MDVMTLSAALVKMSFLPSVQSDDARSEATESSLASLTTTRSHTPTIFYTPTQHSQLIEQCRSFVELTEIFTNSNVSGTNERERLLIEELRFQARALHTSSRICFYAYKRTIETVLQI